MDYLIYVKVKIILGTWNIFILEMIGYRYDSVPSLSSYPFRKTIIRTYENIDKSLGVIEKRKDGRENDEKDGNFLFVCLLKGPSQEVRSEHLYTWKRRFDIIKNSGTHLIRNKTHQTRILPKEVGSSDFIFIGHYNLLSFPYSKLHPFRKKGGNPN